ncbi:HAD family phosphatase [Bacteroides sp. 214]|uniref:HAD family hydrolase n=1 Tax=Bacteroides sp. 214 TaxID=2302935 RepID=UPI0013D61937|nr:HAD family phosphatase [Bacteroides sp. 214]NDW13501.1 HAD family phosphatase [Bacteroides sp. 214]
MIKNLIFDFGGVIGDISRTSAVKAFEKVGVANADDLLDQYHQNGIFLEVEDGSISAEEFRAKLSALTGKEITMEEAKEAWMGFFTYVPVYRLEYLEKLRKQGYNLYILSNTNPFIMSWARSEDFSELGKPLDAYFDKLYLSYQLDVVKPHKEIFDILINDGINPAESVFIDDGTANVEMGKQLGFFTLQPINGTDWTGDLDRLLQEISR